MCGAGSPAGAEREKWPWASLFVLPISCMPCDSERSVTSSPAEGLPVVALVTVPVMFWAAAKVLSAKIHTNIASHALNVCFKYPFALPETNGACKRKPRKGRKILAQRFSAGLGFFAPTALPCRPVRKAAQSSDLTPGLRSWERFLDAVCHAGLRRAPSRCCPSRREWRPL